MSSEVLLRLSGAAKTYPVRRQPVAELSARLLGRPSRAEHRHALQPLSLELRRGEAVGIVGLNGAGKSTLLQLASGVLSPSTGSVEIRGRVAALLELGSAFDPEATGADNIGLYAATLGLSAAEIEARRESIIDFSGLRDSLQAPVKTYSTGMQVRLAFSVATAVDPDILIIDEALSVGDGVFAKRSFDRIMALRERGAALLLSSHALFHIDLFCHRTLWLHRGSVRAMGNTPSVLPRYQEFLDELARPVTGSAEEGAAEAGSALGAPAGAAPGAAAADQVVPADHAAPFQLSPSENAARLLSAQIRVIHEGAPDTPTPGSGEVLHTHSGQGLIQVDFEIQATADEPSPRAAVVLSSDTGRILGSALCPPDAFRPDGPDGRGRLRFEWAHPPLNRGRYRLGVYLLCRQGRFVYAWSDPHAHLEVAHEGTHQGVYLLPGQWLTPR